MNTKILSIFLMSILMLSLMGTFVLAGHEKGPKSQVGDKALNVASEKSKASKSAFWDELKIKLADKKLKRAEKNLDKIAVDGDEKGIKNALRATIMMEKKLESHKEKFVEVHSGILEKQKTKMSEEKLTRLTESFSKIETRNSEAQDRIEQKQENLIARYKILTGATDAEIDALMAELEAEVVAKLQK